MMRRLAVTLLALPFAIGCGGVRLEDRTAAPRLPATAIEEVAALSHPPGNVAVSRTGRIFVSLHPEGSPPMKVAELVDGRPVAWPSAAFQTAGDPGFDTVLSLRIDRQDRLWTLDFARYGRGQPRLLAFDVGTGEVVHRFDFPANVAGFLSMLNDFQVDPDGQTIYIADTSPIVRHPALIVYDVGTRTARRVLDRHPSVRAGDYMIHAPGRDIRIYGLLPLRLGVDSIALDRRGEWLYYGPLTGDRLYRVRSRDLRDGALAPDALAPDALAARVEDYGPKPISDGLSTDADDGVYLTDPEHSAVLRLGPDRTLVTLVKDDRLRWPDGLSFGPDGWVYLTCSALHEIMFRPAGAVAAHAPYHVFRFRPGWTGVPGH
jgi:sugar lactone lactonase YvrE